MDHKFQSKKTNCMLFAWLETWSVQWRKIYEISQPHHVKCPMFEPENWVFRCFAWNEMVLGKKERRLVPLSFVACIRDTHWKLHSWSDKYHLYNWIKHEAVPLNKKEYLATVCDDVTVSETVLIEKRAIFCYFYFIIYSAAHMCNCLCWP